MVYFLQSRQRPYILVKSNPVYHRVWSVNNKRYQNKKLIYTLDGRRFKGNIDMSIPDEIIAIWRESTGRYEFRRAFLPDHIMCSVITKFYSMAGTSFSFRVVDLPKPDMDLIGTFKSIVVSVFDRFVAYVGLANQAGDMTYLYVSVVRLNDDNTPDILHCKPGYAFSSFDRVDMTGGRYSGRLEVFNEMEKAYRDFLQQEKTHKQTGVK